MKARRPPRALARSPLVAALLLGLAGCGAPSVEGTWVVDWSVITAQEAPTKDGQSLQKVLQLALTPLQGGLWLRGDGRAFYRGRAFGEYHDTPAGRWEQDGDEVRITRDVDGDGKPVPEAQRISTSLRLGEGRLRGRVPGMKGELVLKRDPGPPEGGGARD